MACWLGPAEAAPSRAKGWLGSECRWSEKLSEAYGLDLYFKMEHEQRTVGFCFPQTTRRRARRQRSVMGGSTAECRVSTRSLSVVAAITISPRRSRPLSTAAATIDSAILRIFIWGLPVGVALYYWVVSGPASASPLASYAGPMDTACATRHI